MSKTVPRRAPIAFSPGVASFFAFLGSDPGKRTPTACSDARSVLDNTFTSLRGLITSRMTRRMLSPRTR